MVNTGTSLSMYGVIQFSAQELGEILVFVHTQRKLKTCKGSQNFLSRVRLQEMSIFFTHLFVWYSNEHLLPLNFKHFAKFLQNLVQFKEIGRFHTAFVG